MRSFTELTGEGKTLSNSHKTSKTGFESDKMCFSQRETGSDWHCLSKTHLSFPRPACGILTWRNLKGLEELANLTVKFEVKFEVKF